jgi:hypothetical protein
MRQEHKRRELMIGSVLRWAIEEKLSRMGCCKSSSLLMNTTVSIFKVFGGLGNPYIDLAVRGCVGGERLDSEERGATSWFSKIGYEKF